MKKQIQITDLIAAGLIEASYNDGKIFSAYLVAADNCEDADFKQLATDWKHAKKAGTPRALEELTEALLQYEIVIAADTPETLATRRFLHRVGDYVTAAAYQEYGETRLKLIHSSRRELFLKLLSLGYLLKESSVLLARLEIEAAKLNEANLSEWTPDRLLELIHSLKGYV